VEGERFGGRGDLEREVRVAVEVYVSHCGGHWKLGGWGV
jgi:hypothetical protein